MCLIWRNWINKAQESTKQCAERRKIIQTSWWSKAFYWDWKHTRTNLRLLTRADLQTLPLALANIPAADWGELGVHVVYWPWLLIFQLYWSWVEGRGAPSLHYEHTSTKGLLLCCSVPGQKGDRAYSQPWQGAGSAMQRLSREAHSMCRSTRGARAEPVTHSGLLWGLHLKLPSRTPAQLSSGGQTGQPVTDTLPQNTAAFQLSQCKRSWEVLTPQKRRASDLGQKKHKLQNSSEAEQKP